MIVWELAEDRRTIRGYCTASERHDFYPVRHVGEGVYVERVASKHDPRRVWCVDPGYSPSYVGRVVRERSAFRAWSRRTNSATGWERDSGTSPTVTAAALAIGAH